MILNQSVQFTDELSFGFAPITILNYSQSHKLLILNHHFSTSQIYYSQNIELFIKFYTIFHQDESISIFFYKNKSYMNASQQATLNQAIKLLQSLTVGGSGDNAAPVDIPIPEYDTQIQNFSRKAHSLQPEIQKLTQIFIKASSTMKRILSYSQVYKKYSPTQQEKLKNIFIQLSNDIEPLKKNANFFDHCNAIKEILSATFWVFVVIFIFMLQSTPQFIIKGAVQGADYNALKFQKKKVKEHNEWWALISGACKTLQKFAAKNYPMGLSFNPKGEDKWDQILNGQSRQSEQTNRPVVQQKHVAEQKPKPTEVQKGPKQPKKEMVGLTWQIRNYQNQQINLSTQVDMKHGLFIENCINCQIKIDSKFKSLQLNKCQDITLSVKSCVSGLQIMNCKKVSVVVREKTPSISVDKCVKVSLLINQSNIENTDIVSCRASQLNVSVEKLNGEESKQHLISDQLITKWNSKSNKFETKIYDKFL